MATSSIVSDTGATTPSWLLDIGAHEIYGAMATNNAGIQEHDLRKLHEGRGEDVVRTKQAPIASNEDRREFPIGSTSALSSEILVSNSAA